MRWFILALSAPFLYAIVNIFDQYLVLRYSRSRRGSGGLVLFSSLIGIFVSCAIGIFTTGIYKISFLDKLLLILIGGISILWIIFYLFTLESEEVSSVVSWFLLVPVFGYLFGFIFFDETFSSHQIVGSIIIFVGVFLISFDFSVEKKRFKWQFASYMIIVCILISISGTIFKYVTISKNFWISSFWQYAGLGFFGIIIFFLVPKYRQEFMFMNKDGGVKIFILNIVSELITILGNLLSFYAIILAPVALVYLVGSFQPAIVLCLTLVLSKFFPGIIKRSMTRKLIFFKSMAIIIIMIGTVFLLY